MNRRAHIVLVFLVLVVFAVIFWLYSDQSTSDALHKAVSFSLPILVLYLGAIALVRIRKQPDLVVNAALIGGSHQAFSYIKTGVTRVTGVVFDGVAFVINKIRDGVRWYITGFKTDPRFRRTTYWTIGIVAVIAFASYVWVITRPVYLSPADLEDSYTLTREVVPSDGPIIVRLPDGVEKSGARRQVSFEPSIETDWARTLSPRHIAFKLEDELQEGDTYEIVFTASDGSKIEQPFKAVLRPRVESILPAPDSEVNEYVPITLIFNRSMIPLQSLDRSFQKDLPISIAPETPGAFTWVSERQLQFIPETHLRRSSNYTVSIDDGFTSSDGLQVDPVTYEFTVLPLKLLWSSNAIQSYREPIRLRFNQPVDIEKSVFTVRKKEDASPVPFSVGYASRLSYDPATDQKQRIIDRSTIEIRPQSDSLGREGLWGFETEYGYAVDKVYPLEGEIMLDKTIRGSFKTTALLGSVRAASPRSDATRLDLFDPQGTLVLQFSEAVDLAQTSVKGAAVTGVAYGTRCVASEAVNDKETLYEYERQDPEECIKKDDTTTLVVSFNQQMMKKGSTTDVIIEKVVGAEGLSLSDTPRTITLTVVPELVITKTIPETGYKEASSRELAICSNLPLVGHDETNYTDAIAADGALTFYYWSGSQKKHSGEYGEFPCSADEYVTRVAYALVRGRAYTMALSLEDEFGGRAQRSLSFTTEPTLDDLSEELWLRNLHQQYSVTSPEKTKFTFVTENFKDINVSVCKISPERMITKAGTLRNDEPMSGPCVEQIAKTIDLPNEKHKPHYFIVDLKDYVKDVRGSHVITLTHPDYRASYGDPRPQLYEHVFVNVTNMSLIEKRTDRVDLGSYSNPPRTKLLDKDGAPANLYWVVDQDTLAPVPGATVTTYKNTGTYDSPVPAFAANAQTDAQGIARMPIIADVMGAFVTSGGDTAVITKWGDTLTYASQSYEAERMYLYTDRPIYRPGNEVFIKGLHRIGYDGTYEIFDPGVIYLEVHDSRGEQVFAKEMRINEYGTFNTSFTLPADAPLGSYYLNAGEGYAAFDVEEYVPSPFQVTLASVQDEYVGGDTLDVAVDAQHFFGVPIGSGTVTYSITAQDYYFDRSKDSGFRFGSDWYDCYDCGYGDSFVMRGETELVDGVAHIVHPIDFKALFRGDTSRTSKIFVVRSTVEDAQGKSVSGQTSFIVHRASFYASLRLTSRFAQERTEVPIAVKTVDTNGYPVPRSGLRMTIERIEWEQYRRQEVDGGFYSNSQEKRVLVEERIIDTNGSGDYAGAITFPTSGRYEITLTGTDARGNEVWSREMQYIYGKDMVPVEPSNDRTLDIAVDTRDLDVGETTKLIIQSPYPRAKALIAVERGTVMDYEIVDVAQSYFDYDLTVRDAYIPNIVASVVLVSPQPEIKYGEVEFTVDRSRRELDITVTSNKPSYLPGEKVSLAVSTFDHNGVPVPAEVSIAAVDMSVLALKGNPKLDPLDYFYQWFPHNVITSSNLKNVHEDIAIPTGTKGGGGGSPEDLARKKRGIFKDTAFWDATVTTDANGRGVATFTLPDNLTKWRVEAVGITKDTKVGASYLEFEEEKPVMVIPTLPRFVMPGDEFSIGVKAINQTNSPQNVSLSVTSPTLSMVSPSTSVFLPANGSKTAYFKTRAPREQMRGAHTVVVAARNAAFEDVVENIIPITPPSVIETVRLADSTRGETAHEDIVTPEGIHPDAGGLRVRVDSTAAAFLEDSLNYMAEYPYGCTEQLGSKLATLSVIEKVTSIDTIGELYEMEPIVVRGVSYTIDQVIKEGLDRIYQAQHPDGGFAYYSSLKPDPVLTLHMIATLETLRQSGVEIREGVIDKAIAYIAKNTREIRRRDAFSKEYQTIEEDIFKAHILSHIEPRPKVVKGYIGDVRSGITRKNLSKLSSVSLGYVALMADDLRWWDRRNVWKEVERRLHRDVDGIFVVTNHDNIGSEYYETGSKSTALVLRAIIRQGKTGLPYEDMLAWLLAERQEDGAWGTTNGTYEVVSTIAEYVVWKDEQNADLAMDILLDGTSIGTYDTAIDDRLHGFETNIGFEELGLGAQRSLDFMRNDRADRDDAFYYDIAMTYQLDREVFPARDEGVRVSRAFYAVDDTRREHPLTSAAVGDVLVGKLSLDVSKGSRLFGIEDLIPAGFELINFELSTEDRSVIEANIEPEPSVDVAAFMKTPRYATMPEVAVYADEIPRVISSNAYKAPYYPDFKELHDDRLFLFSEALMPGAYTYEYYLRAVVPGAFQHMPARAGELYDPEFFGRTESGVFMIEE